MLLGSYRTAKGRAKLDKLWRDVIRLRSTACEMCDAARAEEAAHFIGRGNWHVRCHPDNGNMLCIVPCHHAYDRQYANGMTQRERREWKASIDGWETVHMLEALARSTEPVDTDAVHAELVRRLEKS